MFILVATNFKSRDTDEEIMCARELLTLGQNVKRESSSDQVETFLPTSVLNSVSNDTVKLVVNLNNNVNNHKTQRVIVQVPNVKPSTGQNHANSKSKTNVSVIRFPNLDGNISDVESSDDSDVESVIEQLSATTREHARRNKKASANHFSKSKKQSSWQF